MLSPKPSADAVAEDGGCADMAEVSWKKVEVKYEMVSYCANSTALSVLLLQNALYACGPILCLSSLTLVALARSRVCLLSIVQLYVPAWD